MNNEAPSLTLEEVTQLAGIEAATLRDWLNGPFGAPSDDIRQLGPFTALAVCIAAELARRNVEISKAAAAGKKFAHTDEGSPQRDYPGALYSRELGTTVLAMDIDGKVQIVPASIADAGLGQRILRYEEIATVIFGPRGVCAINVNPFVAKIEAKIGADFGSLPRKQPHWGWADSKAVPGAAAKIIEKSAADRRRSVIPPQQGGLTDAHARKNTRKYDGFWIVMSYRGQRLINKRSKNGVTSPQSRIQIEVEFVADHELGPKRT